LKANGSSIPTYDTSRDVGSYEDLDESITLWELLYNDPLLELRTLNICKTTNSSFHPGKMTTSERLINEFKNIKPSISFKEKLKKLEIENEFTKSFKSVVESREFRTAVNFNPNILNENRSIISRAIIAEIMKNCEERQKHSLILFDAVSRDDLVMSLTVEIGDTFRSIFYMAIKPFFNLAKTKFTNHIKRKRGAITDKAFMIPGDILLYQVRGNPIRDFIKDCIKKEDSPVILLAHSLGGIACVDLLIMESLPQVKLLITIGSQAPFLYEVDALFSLPYGDPLPDHFPEWINIYDLRDFLSYIGSSIFPGKITDIQVSNRQPFPQSHNVSSYFSNDETWNIIISKIEAIVNNE